MKNFITIYRRLERMDQLIRMECTGSVKDLSEKLNVSERTVHNLRSIMEIYDKKITFSHLKNSYSYCDEPKVVSFV
jgi:transcriptional antiterminator